MRSMEAYPRAAMERAMKVRSESQAGHAGVARHRAETRSVVKDCDADPLPRSSRSSFGALAR